MRERIVVYIAKLVMAGIVAAFSLIGNTLEGSAASMLISPLGLPIGSIPGDIVNGRIASAAISFVMIIVSAALLFAIGAGIRAWDSWHSDEPSPLTEEISKRTSHFSARNMIAYSAIVGVYIALNASPVRSPLASTPLSRTLQDVGLGLATSISVPMVAAGILYSDQMRSTSEGRTARKKGIERSIALSACNIVGVVASGIVVNLVLKKRML